jgi:hypothetical protein
MSKIALTSVGAASIASAVPLMHLLGKRFSGGGKKVAVTVSTMLLFSVGWGVLTTGLSTPPKGSEDTIDDAWRTRQIALSVVGASLVLVGVGAVRYRASLKMPLGVGASAFVAGWGVLTAAFVFSDSDYKYMAHTEKAGRVTHAIVSTLTIMTGAALISMSDRGLQGGEGTSAVALTPKTLEAAAVSTFVLGWANAVAVSCLQ